MLRHNVHADGASKEVRSVRSPRWSPVHVRMRTRGHASEEKAEDGEQVEAANERMEEEDGRGLQNVVEADRRHADRVETM